jgi:hypothetical protein
MQDHVRDRHGTKRDLVVMAHEVERGQAELSQWGISDAVGGE